MINASNQEFMNNRADVVVSSRGPNLLPSVCWGMGGHVHPDGQHVTVWLARAQAGAMLADIASSGKVAVVFSEPFTSRALQVKGSDARVRDACPADGPILAQHLTNMVHEISRVGFAEPFIRAFFELPLQNLAAVEFTAHDLFVQTPGPQAGKPARLTP